LSGGGGGRFDSIGLSQGLGDEEHGRGTANISDQLSEGRASGGTLEEDRIVEGTAGRATAGIGNLLRSGMLRWRWEASRRCRPAHMVSR